MDDILIETVYGIGYRLKPPNQGSQRITDRKQPHLKVLKPENWSLLVIETLTGISSYSTLLAIGKHEFERARRYHSSFSLLITDTDKDKLINDTRGQDVTDKTMEFTAKTIVNCLRRVDRVGRLNSQFAVILPETPLEGAFKVAERVRSAFASQFLTIQDERLIITPSIGIATYRDRDSQFEDILGRAEIALR